MYWVKEIVVFIVLSFIVINDVQGSGSGKWKSLQCYPRKKYFVRTEKVTWSQAAGKCKAEGKVLASVLCDKEDRILTRKLIRQGIKTTADFWLGGQRTGPNKYDWKWISTGLKFYLIDVLLTDKWNKGHPGKWQVGKKSCLKMSTFPVIKTYLTTKWNDAVCDSLSDGYVCEKVYK